MRDLKIKKIEYEKDYKIKLYLSNGHQVIYDMREKLKTARFFDIAKPEIFQEGKVVREKMIQWDENVEISLMEILIQVTETKELKWQNVLLKKYNRE